MDAVRAAMNSGNKFVRQNFETSQVRVLCIEGEAIKESCMKPGYIIELKDEFQQVFGGNKKDTKLAVLQFGISKVSNYGGR